MPDDIAPETRNLTFTLMRCYDRLATVAAKLPVPITLPVSMGGKYWPERTEGVARAAAIAYEVPTSDEVRESLKCACLAWLGASELLTLQLTTPARRHRNEAARMMILISEDYIDDTRRTLNIQG
ncbi:hypothetical protein CTZ27_33215 [Streptomyces griseocarneus]|nr:hypothetical protein CTZ27_33215 [Streptomyces griseocarneus]